MAFFIPSYMLVAPGKSSFEFPVPCQVIVQPPLCFPILSPPSPATKICWPCLIGRTPSFFNRTKDFLTASLATSLCSTEPKKFDLPDDALIEGRPFSNIPARIFTRKILDTASLTRAIGIIPSFTC